MAVEFVSNVYQASDKKVIQCNVRDITERKKIEAQFMRAQHMESIGTLAGDIAHDLNNILSPIMMAIDILKELSDNPQARNILKTLEANAKRGADNHFLPKPYSPETLLKVMRAILDEA
jgi:signal transduction histidine kinase